MPKSVLIIDDEPGITAALMIRMQAAGYEVNHAINGRAGLEAADLHQPDAIVLDLRMPDIDGFEVCGRLRSNPDHASTPIIILSANVADSARQRALDAGADTFMSKPFEAQGIIAMIEQLTESSRNAA